MKFRDAHGTIRDYTGPSLTKNLLDITALEEFNRYTLSNNASETIDHIMKNLIRGEEDLHYFHLASPHYDEEELLSYASYLPRPSLHSSSLPYKSLEVLHKHQFILDITGVDHKKESLHIDLRVYIGILCENHTDEIFYLCARQNSLESVRHFRLMEALVLEIPAHPEEERFLVLHQEIVRPLWDYSIRNLMLIENNLAQAKEIEKFKYFASEKAGHDVGGIFAATEWINFHAQGFREYIRAKLEELKQMGD